MTITLQELDRRVRFPSRYPTGPIRDLLLAYLAKEHMSGRDFAKGFSERHGIAVSTAFSLINKLMSNPPDTISATNVDRIACSCGVPSVFLLDPTTTEAA